MPDDLREQIAQAKHHERHHNHAATTYWCEQYKMLCDELAAALAEKDAQIAALQTERIDLIDLMADCVAQACLFEGKVAHGFLSTYEAAFKALGIDSYQLTADEFWQRVRDARLRETPAPPQEQT